MKKVLLVAVVEVVDGVFEATDGVFEATVTNADGGRVYAATRPDAQRAYNAALLSGDDARMFIEQVRVNARRALEERVANESKAVAS